MYVNRDLEHLRLLAIFHYVLGGLGALSGCIFIIHIVLGALMASGSLPLGPGGPPPAFGWVFIGMGVAVMLWSWTAAALTIAGGRCLSRQRYYVFCFVVACLSCLSVPLGTVLGVFTIVVLCRPSAKALFGVGGAAPAAAPGAAPPPPPPPPPGAQPPPGRDVPAS